MKNGTLEAKAIEMAVAAERERCAKIVRRICGESAHVKLGDAIETAIFNL